MSQRSVSTDPESRECSPFELFISSENYITLTSDIVNRLIDRVIDREINRASKRSSCERIGLPSGEKKLKKLHLSPSDSCLLPRVPTSAEILQDVFERSSSRVLSSSESSVAAVHILSITRMIDSHVCSDLKFTNPLGIKEDLAKTYSLEGTSLRAMVNQITVYVLPLIHLSGDFWHSPLSQGFVLNEDDQVTLVQRRVHAVLTPLFTPLFSSKSGNMTVQIEGRHYIFSASNCARNLAKDLPNSCQGITKGDHYRKLLSDISNQDFCIIGLYVILKLLDLTGVSHPSEVDEKCRALFHRMAQFLRCYCMLTLGPEVGQKQLRALAGLYSWSLPIEDSLKAFFALTFI